MATKMLWLIQHILFMLLVLRTPEKNVTCIFDVFNPRELMDKTFKTCKLCGFSVLNKIQISMLKDCEWVI